MNTHAEDKSIATSSVSLQSLSVILHLERKVMEVKYIKWIGLLGALSAGTAQILAGDIVNGGGVIAAALSSAGVFSAR